MKFLKTALSIMLCCCLLLTGCGGGEEAKQSAPENSQQTETATPNKIYKIGDKIDDFTVTTYDGKTMSLYSILEEKDVVLLNFWATWCGPCKKEFPAIQEAYEQYSDKVEILALSVDDTDTDEILKNYVAEIGMTFPVARDTAGVGDCFSVSSIPVSVVIDRFGVICAAEPGSQPDSKIFTNLFEMYTAEDYTESLVIRSLVPQKPEATPSTQEELNAALNSENGSLVFTNSISAYDWPMTVENVDGRTVVAASNSKHPSTMSMVNTTIEAQKGDAFAVTFKLDAKSALDLMCIEVNGEAVKHFASERDWTTYTHSFDAAGTYEVTVSFTREADSYEDEACLWIDTIELIPQADAAAMLAQNPVYAVQDTTSVEVVNADAKTAGFYLTSSPEKKDYVKIVNGDTMIVKITIDETVDPELAYVMTDSGEILSLLPFESADGYYIEQEINREFGVSSIYCMFGPDIYVASAAIDEDSLTAYCALTEKYLGEKSAWEYVEEETPSASVSGDVTYTVTYTDQNGDPVEGVMCQVCNDTTCQVFVSEANGVCTFTLPAYAYEVHTLRVPEGYEGDTETVVKAPADGGELTFELIKK